MAYDEQCTVDLTVQCVGFARDWLCRESGVIFAEIDIAADIWDKITHYIRKNDGARLPVDSYENGAVSPPAKGDLLVYCQQFLGTGHVAIVTEVDIVNHSVGVCEQNYRNRFQRPDDIRSIPLITHNNRYWLLDGYLIGWKRMAGS